MSVISKQIVSVVLGGGVGSRLYPLTATRSKPAVPIAGKYRLIDIPVSNCLNSGIDRMFVLTQFNSASLNRHIKNTYQFGAFREGFVDILAAEQTPENKGWFKGTADAVRQILPRLLDFDFEYILILSGDQLYQMDYSDFFDRHLEQNADLSIATIPVDDKDAPGFGIMKVDSDNAIRTFIEKPDPAVLKDWTSDVDEEHAAQGKHYLASMGIYLFNKEVMLELLAKNQFEDDFGKGIIPYAIKNNYNVRSYAFGGYWTDIGSIRSFFQASMDLTAPDPHLSFFTVKHTVYTRARMLSPTKLFGTKCEQALIADGCIVKAELIQKSIIGIRSRIGYGTKIIESIIMGKDSYQNIPELKAAGIVPKGIGENCHIEKAIIDINCRIDDDVVIKGGDHLEDKETDRYAVRDGIIIVKKSATFNKGERIGDI